jgi:hypothetical protein
MIGIPHDSADRARAQIVNRSWGGDEATSVARFNSAFQASFKRSHARMEIKINAITSTPIKSQIMRISRAETILTFHST